MNVHNKNSTRVLVGNVVPWVVFIAARLSLPPILGWLFGDKLVDSATLATPLSLVLGAATFIAMNYHRQAVRKVLDSVPVAMGAGILVLLNLLALNQAVGGELTTATQVALAIATMATSYLWRFIFHVKS